jgi:hypothetical protein
MRVLIVLETCQFRTGGGKREKGGKGTKVRRVSVRIFATGLALLIVVASPNLVFAKAKKGPVRQTVIPAAVHAAAPYTGLVRRPHSSNPEWDVYRNGRYVGSDPDPLVRLMLLKDNWTQY